jgi:hypothetical protein
MLRPPFKPLAPPLGVAPHSLRTTGLERQTSMIHRIMYSRRPAQNSNWAPCEHKPWNVIAALDQHAQYIEIRMSKT